MKRWIKDNWIAIFVGLVLPAIIGSLWQLSLDTLHNVSLHTLTYVCLIAVIIACVLTGMLLLCAINRRRVKAFTNKTFYPHNTIHGTYRSIDEEMPINAEIELGWYEATKEDGEQERT